MFRGPRNRPRVLLDLGEQVFDRGVELGILALEGRMGQVVHDDVGVEAVAFDEPLPFWP